jgi:hypothetical protein
MSEVSKQRPSTDFYCRDKAEDEEEDGEEGSFGKLCAALSDLSRTTKKLAKLTSTASRVAHHTADLSILIGSMFVLHKSVSTLFHSPLS